MNHQAEQRPLGRVQRCEASAHHLRLTCAVAEDQATGLLRHLADAGAVSIAHDRSINCGREMIPAAQKPVVADEYAHLCLHWGGLARMSFCDGIDLDHEYMS